jgi:hypothetical protein
MVINSEQIRNWEKSVVAYSQVLSENSPDKTEETKNFYRDNK